MEAGCLRSRVLPALLFLAWLVENLPLPPLCWGGGGSLIIQGNLWVLEPSLLPSPISSQVLRGRGTCACVWVSRGWWDARLPFPLCYL